MHNAYGSASALLHFDVTEPGEGKEKGHGSSLRGQGFRARILVGAAGGYKRAKGFAWSRGNKELGRCLG